MTGGRIAATVDRLRSLWPDAEAIDVVEVTTPDGPRTAVHVYAEGRRTDARLVETTDNPYSGPIMLGHDAASLALVNKYRAGAVCDLCGFALTVGQPGRHWVCDAERGDA